MILFKSCARCGGDIDATYKDDVYCIQCSHRPQVMFPGPHAPHRPAGASSSLGVRVSVGPALHDSETGTKEEGAPVSAATSSCPRCGSTERVRLDRLREADNYCYCYRCRRCGHVFSPAVGERGASREATVS